MTDWAEFRREMRRQDLRRNDVILRATSDEDRACSIKEWIFAHEPFFEADEPKQRAERALRYVQYLQQARQASANGDDALLRKITDRARADIGLVPAIIPIGGFKSENDITYDAIGTGELENLIQSDLQKRDLGELFSVARTMAETPEGPTIQ